MSIPFNIEGAKGSVFSSLYLSSPLYLSLSFSFFCLSWQTQHSRDEWGKYLVEHSSSRLTDQSIPAAELTAIKRSFGAAVAPRMH